MCENVKELSVTGAEKRKWWQEMNSGRENSVNPWSDLYWGAIGGRVSSLFPMWLFHY
jgi:hypothetical protein